jgi:hypothetical protein
MGEVRSAEAFCGFEFRKAAKAARVLWSGGRLACCESEGEGKAKAKAIRWRRRGGATGMAAAPVGCAEGWLAARAVLNLEKRRECCGRAEGWLAARAKAGLKARRGKKVAPQRRRGRLARCASGFEFRKAMNRRCDPLWLRARWIAARATAGGKASRG